MKSPGFQAVIFDFGKVVCFPPTEDQFRAAADRVGLSTADFIHYFWHDRIEYDRGEDANVYWQKIAAHANRTFNQETVQDLIQREIDFWSRFDQRLLSWIDDLHQAGLATAILSNLPRPLGERLRSLDGFLDHFNHVTFSYELGLVKPEPAIYEHALQGLGLQPAQALFLDDRPENVEGGTAIGLPSHLFTTWEEFAAKDLTAYGLPRPTR